MDPQNIHEDDIYSQDNSLNASRSNLISNDPYSHSNISSNKNQKVEP